MSEITMLLNNQLKKNQFNKIIKDEAMGRWFTGFEFRQDVQKLTAELKRRGVGYQDSVLVCIPNMAAYAVIVQAIWEVGAAMHPIAATTPKIELIEEMDEHDYAAYIIDRTLSKSIKTYNNNFEVEVNLLTYPQLRLTINQDVNGHEAKEPQEDDLALIMNTSGTTGKPKRVGLTHKILLNAAKHDIESQQMTDKDTVLVVMPMFHINAQAVCLLSTRLSGGKLVVAKKFSASRFWNQIRENHVTWASVVPTIINILLINRQANSRYSNDIKLRFVRSSSFSLPVEKLKTFQNRFNTIILEGYGMTETASQCAINPLDHRKVGSAGKPFKTEMAILNDGEFSQSPDRVGEIAVRGDHVISSYLDVETNSFQHGWFLTGDLGYFDSDGYLYVKGRKKELINRGGEKVSPAQVESSISQLDFVKEVSVIGLPDPVYGEAVIAVIISRDPQNRTSQEQVIFDQAEKTLANYERPTQVYFVDHFPKNATGKVIRADLQKQIVSMSTGKVHE